jgi:hypothetical protein
VKRKPKILPPLPERAAKMFARLKHVRGLTDIEKLFQALMLAATPDEPWEINQFMVKRLPKNIRTLMLQEVLESASEHERLQCIAH